MNSRVSLRPGRIRRVVQGVMISVGIVIAGAGALVPISQLVRWAERYVSEDQKLTEKGVLALEQLKVGAIVAGLAIVGLGIALGFLAPVLARFGTWLGRKLDLAAAAEAVVSRLGTWTSQVYGFVTREPVLWVLLLLMLFTIPVVGFYLSPAGGFHVEGIDLQPAKNLARHGIYGTLTVEGFDQATYRSSAGPGVILPSALAFWLFGINVYYSRAIAFLFLVAAVLMFHRVATRAYDKPTGWLGTFLLTPVFMPFLKGALGTGSDGYTPAFLYLMVGMLFWFRAVERERNLDLWIAGLFWGLAFQTKWLFLFSLVALFATWVLLRFSLRPLGHRYYLIPSLGVAAVTAIWVAFRIWNVGLRQELNHVRNLWAEHGHRAVGWGTDQAAGLLSSIRPITTLAQVDLWSELQLFLLIPAVCYAVFRVLRGRLADYRALLLLVSWLLWFSWWLLFNYDLVATHSLVPRLLGVPLIAKFLVDAWERTTPDRKRFLELLQGRLGSDAVWAYLVRTAIVLVVLASVAIPLMRRVHAIYTRYHVATKPAREMVTYLRASTEKNAVFSGWAWSLPWYLDLDPAGDHAIKDRQNYPPEQREQVPEYFIVSPEWPLEKRSETFPYSAVENEWSLQANEIRKRFVAEHGVLLKAFGSRDHRWLVYRVREDPLPAAMTSNRQQGS